MKSVSKLNQDREIDCKVELNVKVYGQSDPKQHVLP